MATKSTFGTFSAVTGQPTPSDLQAIADYLLFQSDCQHSWISVNDDVERCVACGVGKLVTISGDDFAETHALYLMPNIYEVRTIDDIATDLYDLMIEHQINDILRATWGNDFNHIFCFGLRFEINDIDAAEWGDDVVGRITQLLDELAALEPINFFQLRLRWWGNTTRFFASLSNIPTPKSFSSASRDIRMSRDH